MTSIARFTLEGDTEAVPPALAGDLPLVAFIPNDRPSSECVSFGDRQNGRVTISTFSEIGGPPWGAVGRRFVRWCRDEVVRTKSTRVCLGRCLAEFLEKVGIVSAGPDEDAVYREQLRRLVNLQYSWELSNEYYVAAAGGFFAHSRTDSWLEEDRPSNLVALNASPMMIQVEQKLVEDLVTAAELDDTPLVRVDYAELFAAMERERERRQEVYVNELERVRWCRRHMARRGAVGALHALRTGVGEPWAKKEMREVAVECGRRILAECVGDELDRPPGRRCPECRRIVDEHVAKLFPEK